MEQVPWPKPSILHRARRAANGGSAYDDHLIRARLAQPPFAQKIRPGMRIAVTAGSRGIRTTWPYVQQAGASALNNVYFTNHYSALDKDPKVTEFIAAYKKKLAETRPNPATRKASEDALEVINGHEFRRREAPHLSGPNHRVLGDSVHLPVIRLAVF